MIGEWTKGPSETGVESNLKAERGGRNWTHAYTSDANHVSRVSITDSTVQRKNKNTVNTDWLNTEDNWRILSPLGLGPHNVVSGGEDEDPFAVPDSL
jgi:hypothetical protein